MFELPYDNHVVRYCRPATLNKNNIPSAQAFELRKHRNEKSLSVDWLEFYKSDKTTKKKLNSILNIYPKRGIKASKNGAIAILNNNVTLKQEAKKNNFKLSIFQDNPNYSHSLIQPSDDLHLSKLLSENIKENYLIEKLLE